MRELICLRCEQDCSEHYLVTQNFSQSKKNELKCYLDGAVNYTWYNYDKKYQISSDIDAFVNDLVWLEVNLNIYMFVPNVNILEVYM